MLRRAARSLVPRVPTLVAQLEGAEAAACSTTARQFTSSAPASGIHIEEEVYNRCVMTKTLIFSFKLAMAFTPNLFNFPALAGSGN